MKSVRLLLFSLLINFSHAAELVDTDHDGIDDLSEARYALDPNNPDDAQGDLDSDGIPNVVEFRAGADMTKRDRVKGVVTDELWLESSSGLVNSSSLRIAAQALPARRSFLTKIAIDYDHTKDNNYIRRICGYITPQVSGAYTFWATADDDCRFLLSTTESKFDRVKLIDCSTLGQGANFDLDPSMKSQPVTLVEGRSYYFELWQTEGIGNSNLYLAWQQGTRKREIVSAAFLSSYEFRDEKDRDNDDLLDAYERTNGLNPDDAGNEGNLKDGWYGDWDEDGLTNGDEQEAGTFANRADSDGDLMNDYDEMVFFKSDPNKKDMGEMALEKRFLAADYATKSNEWQKNEADGSMEMKENTGTLTYEYECPSDGFYSVNFSIVNANSFKSEVHHVSIFFNDMCVWSRNVMMEKEKALYVAALLPYLYQSGKYEISIVTKTYSQYSRVRVNDVKIFTAAGDDTDRNKRVDWVESFVKEKNGLDQLTLLSKTSPAVLEGSVQRPDFMHADGLKLHNAPNRRFFAELRLSPLLPTQQKISFEEGAFEQVCEVMWVPTNLNEGTTPIIRQGDSLRLTYLEPNAADHHALDMTLIVEGKEYQSQTNLPIAIAFPNSGDVEVVCSVKKVDGSISQTKHKVSVLPVIDLGQSLSLVHVQRELSFSNLPKNHILEFDEAVTIQEVTPNENFLAISNTIGESPILLRNGKKGLIVGRGTINTIEVDRMKFTLISLPNGNLPDAQQAYEFTFQVIGKINDEEIRVHFLGKQVSSLSGGTEASFFRSDIDHKNTFQVTMLIGEKTKIFGTKVSIWKNGKKIAEAF